MSATVAFLLKKYFFEEKRFPDLHAIQKLNLTREQRGSLLGTARLAFILFWYLEKKDPQLAKKPSKQHCCALLLIMMQEIIFNEQPLYHVSATLKKALIKMKSPWFLQKGVGVLKNLPSQDELWSMFLQETHSHSLLETIKKEHPDFSFEHFFSHPPLWIRFDHPQGAAMIKETELLETTQEPLHAALIKKTTPEITDLFHKGFLSIQDLAAQSLNEVLKQCSITPKVIIDCCAAPGGKSTALLQQWPSSSFYLTDNALSRLNSLTQNIDRFKSRYESTKIEITQHNWEEPFSNIMADFILLDLPCSGTGVVRRHPDILWAKTTHSLDELVKKQKKLLENASKNLNPGGVLIYSTCSILKRENEEVISSFLNNHPDFSEKKVSISIGSLSTHGTQIMPSKRHDGLYYCQLIKSSCST